MRRNTATDMYLMVDLYEKGQLSKEEFHVMAAPLWDGLPDGTRHIWEQRIAAIEAPVGLDSAVPIPDHLSQLDVTRAVRKARFADGVRFSNQHGWFIWTPDRHTWVPDARGYRVRTEIQRALGTMVDAATNAKVRNTLGSTAMRNAVADMISTDEGVYMEDGVDPWDKIPHLLAAPNGVIDLRTGKLTETDPEQYLTKSVTVPYDPDAECPRWEQFLKEIFPHDPDMPAYLQRLIGYGITGETREQCFAIFHGPGANGKSVVLNVLRAFAGPHAATVPFDMFTGDGKNRGGPDAEHLKGARLALASETNRSAVLDTAAIKNATGGEEINCNPKYRDPFSFTPVALILLATNFKPTIREADNGTWRRIKLIEFSRVFAEHEQDKGLTGKLMEELPGILAWAVRGAVEWYAHGLQDPQTVVDAVQSYKDESDQLSGFYPDIVTAEARQGPQGGPLSVLSFVQAWPTGQASV